MDYGIGDTFVSSVLKGVCFALIDFPGSLDGEKPYDSGMIQGSRYQSVANTIVQLRSPFCSG
ncbi:MAG: hypothetical protein WB817_15530 [Terriglobales bacterium]